MRPLVRLVSAVAGLLGVLVALHRMPIDSSPTEPTLLWWAGLRSAALATGWYLLGLMFVGGLARLVRLRPLVRTADRFTPRRLRRVLDASLGLSMLATVTATPAAWAAPPTADGEPPPATMLRLPDRPADESELGPAPTSTSSSSSPSAPRMPVTREHRDTAPTTTATAPTTTSTTTSSTTTTTTLPRRSSPALMAAPARPQAPPAPTEADWTVERGDHFWSISTRVLTQAWRRPPTDAEVDAYWRTLVAANRNRLADRDNPDLLFAGQVLGIPPPPPAPSPAPP